MLPPSDAHAPASAGCRSKYIPSALPAICSFAGQSGCRCIRSLRRILLLYCFLDLTNHIVDHLIGHSRINTDPECVRHDLVCHRQIADHTIALAGLLQLAKARLL